MKDEVETMEFDFLQQFHKRMQSAGAYVFLVQNSILKGTWKQYGFDEFYEQMNMIFSVLLYIMEQSLKEEHCTMDDIGNFIDRLNMKYYKKEISYEQCRRLADFIVNVILCDDGKAIYFNGMNYETGEYEKLHISYVGNRIVYLDDDVRRTSYYLTEAGYQMMLGTLEMESNMKLTVHEMIFKLHLDKATYDKAADDVKQIFNLLRIQLQKMQQAMWQMKQNALQYSVKDYRELLEENLSIIEETKQKFLGYRENVKERVRDLEERDINIKKLGAKEEENLKYLKIIEGYLNRSIEEHQKILSTHFDMKALYTKELESLSQMSLIERFDIRSELYDKVLQDSNSLLTIEKFLHPLFLSEVTKQYNLNKTLEYQIPIRKAVEEDESEELSFDQEKWELEENDRKKQQLKKYKSCLKFMLQAAFEQQGISLSRLKEKVQEEDYEKWMPTVEIFREVMIELLKEKNIDIGALKKEKKEILTETVLEFQMNEMIIELIEENPKWSVWNSILAVKVEDSEEVVFENILSETGERKKIRCSDVWIEVRI